MVLVGLVLSRLDLDELRGGWRGMPLFDAAWVIAVLGVATGLRVGKWAWQLRVLGFRFTDAALVRGYFTGGLLGAVTPMRAGELARLAVLEIPASERATRLPVAAAALLLEKGYELLGLLLIVLVGAALTMPPVALVVAVPVVVGLAFGLGNVYLPVGLAPYIPRFVRERALAPLFGARDGLDVRQRVVLLALCLGSHLLNTLAGLRIYRAFGDVGAFDFVFRLPLVTLSNAVPVTIGGFGLRELTAMQLFGERGISPSGAAAAASLLFFGANLLFPLIVLPIIEIGRVGRR